MIAGRRLIAALAVGICAFGLYRSTLLPNLDFGDTPSFQVTVGSPFISPRDGYPLYFVIGALFLRITHAEPAHALNLSSAFAAALGGGVITLLAAELSGSIWAGAGVALLFAGSYTFWSQAVIAEVYALHLLFVSLTLLILLAWEKQPTECRLALFFAVYALGFGNHLSMILLAPGYTMFLLGAPRGWRTVVTPRVAALATTMAALAALQYVWNFRTLWVFAQPPRGLIDALQHFWFDVTKSDWRDTMVGSVSPSMLADRVAMYAFDLRQQFGLAAIVLAMAGLLVLASQNRRRALLLLLLYGVNVLFAYSYNVGDTHVFYLPSHLVVALLVAPGIAFLGTRLRRPHLVAALLIVYAGTRIYSDYPALDRSDDHRPTEVLSSLTAGLDDQHAVLLTDLNWQIQNGLTYFARRTRPDLAYALLPEVMLYAPALVADNLAIGREVVLTERARRELADLYGPLLPAVRDTRIVTPTIDTTTRHLAAGTRYVLCVLKPVSEAAVDWNDLGRALIALGDGAPVRVPDGDYVAIAGVVGIAPRLLVGKNRPFRRIVSLEGVDVQIRMESWLNADTIRRMGFGHVVAARHHSLIVERGVSFVALDERGRALATAYESNIFAPQPRYLIQP